MTDIIRVCNNVDVLIEQTDYYLIELYADNYYRKFQNQWEMTRFIAYITAQCQSTKRLSPDEIMKFPWSGQKSDKKGKTQPIDDEKRQKIIAEMQKLEKKV
jgi:hypothetical protein